ncbi:MAG: hypothetical protein ACE5D7_03360, partial [Fidelibacterota bacterium]
MNAISNKKTMTFRPYNILIIIIILLQVGYTQKISNITQKIENGRVVIEYDLTGKTGEEYDIHLTAEKDGVTFLPRVVAGDLTHVEPGKGKYIWWEPVLEGRQLTGWHITLSAEKPLFKMVFIPGGTFEMGCGS